MKDAASNRGNNSSAQERRRRNIMTLLELQKVLGERIRIAVDENLSMEDRKKETELSQTISSLAKQMINNADIVLRTNKLVADGTIKNSAIERMVGE